MAKLKASYTKINQDFYTKGSIFMDGSEECGLFAGLDLDEQLKRLIRTASPRQVKEAYAILREATVKTLGQIEGAEAAGNLEAAMPLVRATLTKADKLARVALGQPGAAADLLFQ